MKKILYSMLLLPACLSAQNIGIGIGVPSGKLHIKGNANTSQLVIDANTAQSNNNPLIRLRNASGTDLLHIHSDDPSNTFVGLNAGRINIVSIGFQGQLNTAIGANSLYSNTSGYRNTATGTGSLYYNTTGTYNTANGEEALKNNTTGGDNTACGTLALTNNITGYSNTALGGSALGYNTIGADNTAIGQNALFNTSASNFNTALGYCAGCAYNNGYNNVFVGSLADVNQPDLYNVIAIGKGTIVSASSTARFGNPSTGSYGGYADWTNISDGRFKKNIREDIPGIDFIMLLRPVTYNMDATGVDAFLHKNDKKDAKVIYTANIFHGKALQEKEKIRYTGFIAQEVEAAAKKLGFDFSGVDAAKNENDVYGLRYAEFVVPLVKAVQEQQQQMAEMKKQIDLLNEQNKKLMLLLENKK